MFDPRFEPATPVADEEIREIERTIGRKLPLYYCAFIKKYGGAFVGGLVDGSDELPILVFFDASEDGGILSKLKTHHDLLLDGVVPIADCVLGNLYVFDAQDEIYYINYYGSRTTARKVAGTFQEFISRIVVPDE